MPNEHITDEMAQAVGRMAESFAREGVPFRYDPAHKLLLAGYTRHTVMAFAPVAQAEQAREHVPGFELFLKPSDGVR